MQSSLDAPKPRFSISIERAMNLGNYESLRIGLSQSYDVGTVGPDQAYEALLRKVEEWTSKAKPALENPAKKPRGPVASGPVVTLESLRDNFKNELENLDIIEGLDGFTVRPKRYLGSSWTSLNVIAKSLGGRWIRTSRSPSFSTNLDRFSAE